MKLFTEELTRNATGANFVIGVLLGVPLDITCLTVRAAYEVCVMISDEVNTK